MGEVGLGEDSTASPACASLKFALAGEPSYHQVPKPRDDVRGLFDAASIVIPTALPLAPARVATKKKLPQRRKVK